MKCTYFNAQTQAKANTVVTWKMFYPQCPKINPFKICNTSAGAYLSAVTVCGQRLF